MEQNGQSPMPKPEQGLAVEPGNQPPVATPKPKHDWRPLVNSLLLLVVLGVVVSCIYWVFNGSHKRQASSAKPPTQASVQAKQQVVATKLQGVQLDAAKNYGDKYASGLLPVGDGKYVTTAPKQGFVYACSGYAQNLASSAGGAGQRGPWFVGTAQYDINKKLHVRGSVTWPGDHTMTVKGDTRTITSNDLPLGHTTGIFPISTTDPAYAYDRNPNSIKAQSFTYNLDANPTYGDPTCIGGQVGVMLTGVALFSAFDAGGRDAGAWEVQDGCSGHPEKTGTYHYHTLSSCIKDTKVGDIIGFALDGFPITGPQVAPGNVLTSSNLDVCHGLTSQITLDGKKVTMYHYVMTEDFPYSVACYRGTAIQPPGQPGTGQSQPGVPNRPQQ